MEIPVNYEGKLIFYIVRNQGQIGMKQRIAVQKANMPKLKSNNIRAQRVTNGVIRTQYEREVV